LLFLIPLPNLLLYIFFNQYNPLSLYTSILKNNINPPR